MCKVHSWKLEPRLLPSTPHKYLHLWNDHCIKDVVVVLKLSYYWMLNESLSKLINKPPKRQNTLLIMERTTETAEKKTQTNMAGYIYIYNIIL